MLFLRRSLEALFPGGFVRVCVLSAVFAYLSKIAMFSSWDTPLLGSGFLLSCNSLGSLLKDGDWPYWSSFMLLSHPVVAHQRDSYQSANTHTECRLGYCTPQYWQLFTAPALSCRVAGTKCTEPTLLNLQLLPTHSRGHYMEVAAQVAEGDQLYLHSTGNGLKLLSKQQSHSVECQAATLNMQELI